MLTAVALASRCFGRVSVAGAAGEPYRAALPLAVETLEEAAALLGVTSPEEPPTHSLLIGDGNAADIAKKAVRATWKHWVAAVSPADEPAGPCEGSFSLAAVAAAALAVGELFQQRLNNPRAGRFTHTISLWDPATGDIGPTAPTAVQLPKDIWLIGLGNLGQAFLWALASLNFQNPHDVSLVLQDFDRVDEENFGTSILTGPDDAGTLKTFIAEQWCLARGYRVNRVDRALDEHTIIGPQEPRLAFSGLDKIRVRKLLGDRGFQYVIDAGLGSNASDFDRFRINTFDKDLKPSAHFAEQNDDNEHARADAFIAASEAYKKAVDSASPAAACGLREVAGKSVAVPYVSSVAACLVIAQAIRLVTGHAPHMSIAGHVCNIEGVEAREGSKADRLTVGSTPHASGAA
ncbi:ThiF family adenylyltransferase [Paraburkholderia fungorum]|uniref:ThiF family adenylyltransferase n=1 Tax=Paraburkholderia fungorum TaxID=134537 RepID=UPI003877B382